MFEEQDKENAQEPVDMFADIEKPQQSADSTQNPLSHMAGTSEEAEAPIKKIAVIVGGVVVGIVVLGALAFGIFTMLKNTPSENQPVPQEQTQQKQQEAVSTPQTPPGDTDGDGLSDEEEKTLGTDARLIDTDSDGLSDREEILVYKTNPLNEDTDGDSFLDGNEIKAGFNPNGSGKLIQIPPQQ
jgi:flagellar biosynthesis/type III secretory pathway M-ring protein FliF/YscJ